MDGFLGRKILMGSATFANWLTVFLQTRAERSDVAGIVIGQCLFAREDTAQLFNDPQFKVAAINNYAL
jgi:hypothetical protein